MTFDLEAEVAQDLGAEPIARADILKSDHAVLRTGPPPAGSGLIRSSST